MQNFSEYIIYGHENDGQNSKAPGLNDHNSWNKCPCRRYYSSGATTLRVMWMIRGRAAGIEIAPANEFHEFRSLNPSPASIFCEISCFSKFPVHGTGCLVTYNFFVSQRPAVILSENEIQTPADTTIFKCFQNTSFSFTKTMVKIRKRTDCTTTFRRAIAFVDDNILPCNHATNY